MGNCRVTEKHTIERKHEIQPVKRMVCTLLASAHSLQFRLFCHWQLIRFTMYSTKMSSQTALRMVTFKFKRPQQPEKAENNTAAALHTILFSINIVLNFVHMCYSELNCN